MTPQEFYSQYLPYAEKVSNQTGLDPRLVLAQAALETGYGKSAPNMNFFGIKSHGRKGGQTLQTSEFENGQMVGQPALFRGYESPDQSFQDYASFLKSNPRYEGVLSAEGLEDQISAMAKSGYATDPNYGAKLANIAGKFDPSSPPIIASDTMRVLGKQPKGLLAVPEETNDTESKMIPEEKPKGLLGSLGIQKMEEGAEGEAGQRFYNRDSFGDTMAALAPALGRMGVMGLDVPAQAMADRRFAKRDQEQKTSKTIEALSRMNTPQAKQALEYLSAGGDPVAALKIAFGSTDNGVQSSSTLRDRSGVVLTMRDGSIVVKTAGGETISGDAALKFVRDSEEAYAKSEQSIYGARRTGTNEADIETGGTAAAAIEAGKATIKRGFEVYDKVNQTGASISTINSAIDAIDSGAKSGPVYNMLPKFDESSAALNSAMNQMGLDVISSVTFGALSAGEMNLAMETAVPRNLDPQELRSYLVKKRDAQMKARDALMAAARYLTTPGNTVTGWMDQQSQRPAVVPSETPIPLGTGTISREDALKTLTGG